jgi:hypothetical protein
MTRTSSAVLRRVVIGATADMACASHGGEELLQLTEQGAEGRADASALGRGVAVEDGLGQDGEGDVAMPADVAAALTWSIPSRFGVRGSRVRPRLRSFASMSSLISQRMRAASDQCSSAIVCSITH